MGYGIRERLASQAGPKESALVFTAVQGGPLWHSNFYKRVWLPAKSVAGLPDGLRIHDLRHTCPALLIAQGASPKAIQAHLGHSSIQVTFDRYGHLFPEDLEDLAARLDAARETSLADCQVPVPARQVGSGTYTTLARGLGRGVDPLRSASGVGKGSVNLVGVVFGSMGADESATG